MNPTSRNLHYGDISNTKIIMHRITHCKIAAITTYWKQPKYQYTGE